MTHAGALKERIENLRERIEALQADAAPIRKQLSNLDSQTGKLSNEMAGLKAQLAEANKAPRVSDHAVIRYLERKHGFDFEHVREELLTPAVLKAMEAGADGVKLPSGTVKITGKTVVTFIGKQTAARVKAGQP